MNSESETTIPEHLNTEQRILDVAQNKDLVDWKAFLYQLIHSEGLNPWDIELGVLTKKYLEAIKEIKEVDFEVSGKFLTIAVFLLKTKAELLVERDLRGIEQKIAAVQNTEDFEGELDELEGFDNELEDMVQAEQSPKEKYVLRYRNPLARKRKVTIFDLIRALEKTFEQSNKRKANFLDRKGDGDKYTGPMYEKKTKDLKTIIEDMYNFIVGELLSKKGSVCFHHLVDGVEHKMGVLEKFIPLLHLHNQSKLKVSQDEHFGDIIIEKSEEE
ncbi:MAG: segregation/condensation protein A [Nanoarchaeota archaeon]